MFRPATHRAVTALSILAAAALAACSKTSDVQEPPANDTATPVATAEPPPAPKPANAQSFKIG